MEFGPAFYTSYWSALRARHPDLDKLTRSGWHRRPHDDHFNYVGHRLPNYRDVYTHIAFRMPGGRATRDLVVQLYSANRNDPEWPAACARLEAGKQGGLTWERTSASGRLAAHWVHIVQRGRTTGAFVAEQDRAVDATAAAYRSLLSTFS